MAIGKWCSEEALYNQNTTLANSQMFLIPQILGWMSHPHNSRSRANDSPSNCAISKVPLEFVVAPKELSVTYKKAKYAVIFLMAEVYCWINTTTTTIKQICMKMRMWRRTRDYLRHLRDERWGKIYVLTMYLFS